MKTDFEEWAKTQDPAFIRDVFSAAAAFQAAQQSERDKYAELIAAAKAVIKQWEPPLCPVIYRLLDVIERMKNED